MSAADSEPPGWPEPALPVILMMCLRILLAASSNSSWLRSITRGNGVNSLM